MKISFSKSPVKEILMFISIALLFVSCSTAESADLKAQSGVQTDLKEADKDQPQLEPLGEACAFEDADVAAVFGWDEVTSAPNQLNSDKLKACSYTPRLGGRFSIVRQRYDDDYTVNREGLARSFASTLADEENDFNWKSLGDTFGDEAMYGYGRNGPNNVYTLLYRMGNHTRIELTYNIRKKQNPDKMLKKLKTLAAKL